MKKLLNSIKIQLIASVLIISLCSLYLYVVPESSSWLHWEDKQEGSYKIGKIDFWLNGIENHSLAVDITATAPTRFFHNGVERDDNFDMVAKVYEITGKNLGDIDVNVDLTCTDNNASNTSIFYVFVPSDTTDSNFLNKSYRNYLDSLFSGYTLTTPTLCKTAMNAINTAELALIKNVKVQVSTEKTIAYLVVWAEYDNINYGAPGDYVSINYPITIHANAHQDYLPV